MNKHLARHANLKILALIGALTLAGCGTQAPQELAQPTAPGGGGGDCTSIIECPPPPLHVVQTIPSVNKVGAALSSNISVEFNYLMNAASSSNFLIKSPFRGKRSGSYSGASSKTLVFDSSQNFLPGEEIEYTLTKDHTATDGKTLPRPYTYRFMAAAINTGPGNGTFNAPLDVDDLGWPSHAVALGLFSGDNHLDIASVNGDNIRVVVGDGTGDFDRPSDFYPALMIPIEGGPRHIKSADINGDGKPDLLTGNSDGSVSVLINNWGPWEDKFNAPFTTDLGTGMNGLAVADFDGDGKLDVAVNLGTKVKVIYGNGSGGFRKEWVPVGGYWTQILVVSSVDVPSSRSIASGDVNADGRIDLVLAGELQVSVIKNNLNPVINPYSPYIPQPHFANPTNYSATSGFGSYAGNGVAMADLSGDGKPEIIYPGLFSISVYKNTGGGSYEAEVVHTSAGTHINNVMAADVNGDHKLDIIAACEFHGVKVLIGNGLAGFNSKTWFDSRAGTTEDGAQDVLAGDVDGDGDLDLIVGHYRYGAGNVTLLGNKN